MCDDLPGLVPNQFDARRSCLIASRAAKYAMAKMALPCRSMPPKKIKSMVDGMGVFLCFWGDPVAVVGGHGQHVCGKSERVSAVLGETLAENAAESE